MTGRSTILATAEMYRLAEEATPKVRQELVRLGCQNEITIKQADIYIRLNYHDRALALQPHILLSILQQIEPGKPSEHVWKSITGEIQNCSESTIKKLAILMLILMLAAFTIIFLSQS